MNLDYIEKCCNIFTFLFRLDVYDNVFFVLFFLLKTSVNLYKDSSNHLFSLLNSILKTSKNI